MTQEGLEKKSDRANQLDSEQQAKLKEIIEKEERRTRFLSGFWHHFVSILCFGMVLFYFYAAAIQPQSVQLHRGIYVLLTFVIIFLLYPLRAREHGPFYEITEKIPASFRGILFNKNRPGAVDILLALTSIYVVGYWIFEYESLNYRTGAYNNADFWVSVVGLLIGLEVSRRLLGWSMTLVGIFFMLYALYGSFIPGPFGHRGQPLERAVTYFYLEQDGLFGVMANVLATYVILFIFFGAFLRKSGVSRFFMDFPLSVAGRTAGGPAKVSVLASGFFGSISGSAIANTVSTGTFTIPLMKRAGFRPHVAGAIEPAASIGGMFMPPVMGAGGFLMSELTGIPYVEIMMMAIFPAFIYFLSVFVQIHLEAKKFNVVGLDDAEIQSPLVILRKQWYFVTPLVIIVAMMLYGFSASFSAFYATVSCVVISWFDRDYRMGPKQIYEAMVDGAKGTLIIGATVGVIGIIVGAISLTGIGLKFSDFLISLADGRLIVAIVMIALASLILGMGVPVTAAYLIVAVLAVPALEEMGVIVIAAHMIVYWFSQDSNITPPVCVAAYAGAAIAGSDPWKTGWTAFKYAKMLYVMPILFAYTPAVLLYGDLTSIITSFVTATIGTLFFGVVTQGFLLRRTTWWEWLVAVAATILTYVPLLPYYPAGIALFALLFFWQKISLKRGEAAIA